MLVPEERNIVLVVLRSHFVKVGQPGRNAGVVTAEPGEVSIESRDVDLVRRVELLAESYPEHHVGEVEGVSDSIDQEPGPDQGMDLVTNQILGVELADIEQGVTVTCTDM